MANNEFTIPIPARLKNVAKGGHVAGADQIIDDALGKEQSEINQDRIDDIAEVKGGSTKSIADISEDISNEVERASDIEAGLRESIDELGQIGLNPDNAISTNGDDFDGDTTAKRSKIPTIGAIIDGNPGVYDISKRNPTGGPNNDGKFTLEYILDNANTLIPTSRRHGGMEICFVQSSDNKYVQYRLMSDTFNTTVANWQGVDDEPTVGSKNLVTSGGVYTFRDSYKSRAITGSVLSNNRLELPNSFIRMNTILTANVKFNDNFEGVELGRGNAENNLQHSAWFVVNSTTVTIYSVSVDYTPLLVKTFTHGLSITDFVNIDIISNIYDAYIVVTTKSGSYTSDVFMWHAGGIPYIKNLGTSTITASLSYAIKKEDIMFIHDSYGLYWQEDKWTYYLFNKGINGIAADGQTGYKSNEMMPIIYNDLYFYRPKYMIYAIGMNNVADIDTITPDPIWLSDVETIKNICKREGITLIFCTIPSVPSKLHDGKNHWIKSESGCRYIDVADAVGAQSDGTWYSGMLSSDNIHPTILGAQVIAARVLSDFSEIAITDKYNIITDEIPTENSINLVESGGVFSAINKNTTKIVLKGIGNALSWSDAIPVVPGLTYSLNVNNSINTDQFTNESTLLCVSTTKGDFSAPILIVIKDNLIQPILEKFYKFKVPDNIDTVYLAARITDGVSENYSVQPLNNINQFITIASTNSLHSDRVKADYVVSNSNHAIATINQVLQDLIDGGHVLLCDGTYRDDTPIRIPYDNVIIEGASVNTIINNTEGNGIVIGNHEGIILKNFTVNGLNGTPSYMENVNIQGVRKGTQLSSVDIMIAASNASDEDKYKADYVCTGTSDETIISTAINKLTNGGVIHLSLGTYNIGSYISINKDGITLEGCGYGTIISRSSVLALRVTDNKKNIIIKDINFGNHTVENQYNDGLGYIYRCWIGGIFVQQRPTQVNAVYVAPEEGIDGINNAIKDFAQKGISGKVLLGAGEYSGSDGIRTQFYISSQVGTVYANGVEIEGCGYSTYINRDSVNNTFIFTGIINENRLKFSNMRIKKLDVPSNTITVNKDITFNDIWIGDKYYQEYSIFFTPTMSVGEDYAIKTFYELVRHFASSTLLPKEVHLYGEQKFTDVAVLNNIGNIKFVGHNAHLILKPTNGNIQFALYSNGCVFENIIFEKRGCSNYWNVPCFTINASVYDATFRNCKFINNSSSPTPFNPANAAVGDESYVGGRRHGIYIDSNYYGEDCKIAFYNCVAQGSPYGHQNTRGWYISYGEPKLYNCIGYGGGVGEYGHGIVCHRNSKPLLFNFIGYAGEMSYRMAAGIRTQAAGSPTMIGCIGYGGCHLQYKSDGVPYNILHQKCVEAGIIDESFFYNGTTVNYDGLTLKSPDDGYNETRRQLLSLLDSDDVVITSLGTNSYKNYGIALWFGEQKPKMINCIGYAGGGENSCGLIMEDKNIPTVIGGYYGIEDISDDVTFVNDNGHNYMTFLPDRLNILTPYTVTGAVLIRGTYQYVEGDTIHIETDEQEPKIICDSPYTSNNILPLNVIATNVSGSVKLKVSVINNGVEKAVPDNGFGFKLTYNYNNLNTRALSVGADAKPQITSSHFETNAASSVIEALCSNDEYSISNCTVVSRGNEDAVVHGQDTSDVRMFACVIKGTVDSSVTFAQTESVNNSSNIKVI